MKIAISSLCSSYNKSWKLWWVSWRPLGFTCWELFIVAICLLGKSFAPAKNVRNESVEIPFNLLVDIRPRNQRRVCRPQVLYGAQLVATECRFQRLVCFRFWRLGRVVALDPFAFYRLAKIRISSSFGTFSPCVFFPVCLGNPQSCTLNSYMGSVIVKILQTGFRFPILEIWDFDIGGCLNRATVGK